MEIFEDDLVRLSAFSAMGQDIALARTLPETIEKVMHHIGTVFSPVNWSLLLRDSQVGSLKFVHVTGPGSDAIRNLVLNRGQGVAGWVAENGQPLLIADVRADSRFHIGVDRLSGFVTKSIIAVPLMARGRVYGVIELINKLDESLFTDRDLLVLRTIADFAAIAIERAYYLRAVKRLALTDALTNLHNRRSFEAILEREVEKTRRTGQRFALLILDIDHFKSINDKHGHAAGDTALRAVAKILLATARKIDCCARLGGDEFAVLLPDTAEGDAPFVVRRIQRAIDDHNQGAAIPLSVSIGARTVDPRNPEAILAQADQAMYDAKAKGGSDPQSDLEGDLGSWLDEDDSIDLPPDGH
jgi:diguanylate cyclase (GGDEF)-like protein